MKFLIALLVLSIPCTAGEIVQHVRVNSSDPHVLVAPAPLETVAIEIRNRAGAYRSKAQVKQVHPTLGTAAMTYSGTANMSVWHYMLVDGGQYSETLYACGAGSQPTIPALAPYTIPTEGFTGPSAATKFLGFPFAADGVKTCEVPWLFSIADGPDDTHVLQASSNYAHAFGGVFPGHWGYQNTWRMFLEFDLVYVTP